MGNRASGAFPGGGEQGALIAALQKIRELEGRLSRLEAQGGQQLPGDFRFVPSADGRTVLIVRVSTGGEQQIAGPL